MTKRTITGQQAKSKPRVQETRGFCKLFLRLGKKLFFLGLAEFFQNGYQQDAHKDCGKAAVIQAEAAVQAGYKSDHTVMHHSCHETVLPAVLVANRRKSVGIAQTHNDGLGVDCHRERTPCQCRQLAEHKGCCHIAYHNGPDIGGTGARVTAAKHTETEESPQLSHRELAVGIHLK